MGKCQLNEYILSHLPSRMIALSLKFQLRAFNHPISQLSRTIHATNGPVLQGYNCTTDLEHTSQIEHPNISANYQQTIRPTVELKPTKLPPTNQQRATASVSEKHIIPQENKRTARMPISI